MSTISTVPLGFHRFNGALNTKNTRPEPAAEFVTAEPESSSHRGTVLLPMCLPGLLLTAYLFWARMFRGQRASTVVVSPPRGVNSPLTMHHAG